MKTPDMIGFKYLGIGFASLVIAMAILRTLNLLDYGPGVAAAIMLSVLVASGQEIRQSHPPDA